MQFRAAGPACRPVSWHNIHAGIFAALAVPFHRVRRESDDRRPPALDFVFKATNFARCLIAVALRHLHVHQDNVVAVLRLRSGAYRQKAVGRYLYGVTVALKQRFDQLLIDDVVFGNENGQSA
jgi:hypothetical protein